MFNGYCDNGFGNRLKVLELTAIFLTYRFCKKNDFYIGENCLIVPEENKKII